MALIKKNSEVPSYALIFAAELINKTTERKKVLHYWKIAFFLYIMAPLFLYIRPRSSSTKQNESSLFFFFKFRVGSAHVRSVKRFVPLTSRAFSHAPDHLRVSRVSPERQREKGTACCLIMKLIMKTNKIWLFWFSLITQSVLKPHNYLLSVFIS